MGLSWHRVIVQPNINFQRYQTLEQKETAVHLFWDDCENVYYHERNDRDGDAS